MRNDDWIAAASPLLEALAERERSGEGMKILALHYLAAIERDADPHCTCWDRSHLYEHAETCPRYVAPPPKMDKDADQRTCATCGAEYHRLTIHDCHVAPPPKRDAVAELEAIRREVDSHHDTPYDISTILGHLDGTLALLRSERDNVDRVAKEMRATPFNEPGTPMWIRAQVVDWACALERR